MTISRILSGLIITATSLALARKLIFVSSDMETAAHAHDVYRPRNPRASDYFKCTQAHFEELEMLWPPARRAYGSERMIAINSVTGSGDPMSWM